MPESVPESVPASMPASMPVPTSEPMPAPVPAPVTHPTGADGPTVGSRSTREIRGSVGRVVAILIGCAACAWIWTGISYSWPGEADGEEILDETTYQEVLDGIERAGLYVLDVERIETHIHVQLEIVVDGEAVVIAQTGVDMDTLTAAPIHTHDETGVLHIETDETHPESPTVEDFLRLWQRDTDGDAACGWIVDGPCELEAARNGERFELDDTVEDGDTVRIVIRRT